MLHTAVYDSDFATDHFLPVVLTSGTVFAFTACIFPARLQPYVSPMTSGFKRAKKYHDFLYWT